MKNPGKVIVTVAPVCPVGKKVPSGCANPVEPEEIAIDVTKCARAGATQVCLHALDKKGKPTSDMEVFGKTIDQITKRTDIIIQGSTGGPADLSVEERCVCLDEPRVEVASLNMGSANFDETVCINSLPDIRFWAKRMREKNVVPKLEIYDLSMMETCSKLAGEGILKRSLHYNFCLGTGTTGNLSPTMRNLQYLESLREPATLWGVTHDSMEDFSLLAGALAMGAQAIRVGFEDSFMYAPGKYAATNVELVERVVELVHSVGLEPANPAEARLMLGLDIVAK